MAIASPGNPRKSPSELPLDVPANAVVVRVDDHWSSSSEGAHAAHSLPDGEMLYRQNVDEIYGIAKIVLRYLYWLLPAMRWLSPSELH